MIRVGIIGPTAEARRNVARCLPPELVEVFQAQDATEIDLVETRPDLVFVEGFSTEQLLVAIRLLSSGHPSLWVLAVGENPDAQEVISAVHSGARDFLSKPLTEEMVRSVVARYQQEHPKASVQRGRIFLVTSPKGGSGSTSTAINLAAATSALTDRRVGIVDLSFPLGDVSAYLGLKPKYTVRDSLESSARLDVVMLESLMVSKEGFSVLAGPNQIAEYPELQPGALKRLSEVLRDIFGFTFIDLSSPLNDVLLRNLLVLSDELVMLMTAEIPAIWRALRFLYYIENCSARPRVSLVLNRVGKDSEITKKDVEKTLEREVAWELPNNYRAMIGAINEGRPVVNLDGSNIAASFKELAVKLTGLKPSTSKKKSIFGIFS